MNTVVIDWHAVITNVVHAMRSNLPAIHEAAQFTASYELTEFRTFSFKAGRYNGKSTGMAMYVKANDKTAIYDSINGMLYASRAVGAVRNMYSKAMLDYKQAFDAVAVLGVKTLFLNDIAAVENGLLLSELFEVYYAENAKMFDPEFILVVEK